MQDITFNFQKNDLENKVKIKQDIENNINMNSTNELIILKKNGLKKLKIVAEQLQKMIEEQSFFIEENNDKILNIKDYIVENDVILSRKITELYDTFIDYYIPFEYYLKCQTEYFPKEIEYIKGVFNKDFFIVKTPRLYSKNMSKRKRNNDYYFNSTQIFKNEVFFFLEKNKDKIPNFDKKNITIISVYDRNNTLPIPDNDNQETKGITDAIAYHTNGDSGENCSFFLTSLENKNIEKGTYYYITGKFFQPEHQNTIEKILLEYFLKK